MKRGEIWTVAGGNDYAGKPRPAVIVQDNQFNETNSVTVCPLTTSGLDAPLVRLSIQPDSGNGLTQYSFLMVDKITTIPKIKVKHRVGALNSNELVALNSAISIFLGLNN